MISTHLIILPTNTTVNSAFPARIAEYRNPGTHALDIGTGYDRNRIAAIDDEESSRITFFRDHYCLLLLYGNIIFY
jgi:hypothetical protein